MKKNSKIFVKKSSKIFVKKNSKFFFSFSERIKRQEQQKWKNWDFFKCEDSRSSGACQCAGNRRRGLNFAAEHPGKALWEMAARKRRERGPLIPLLTAKNDSRPSKIGYIH